MTTRKVSARKNSSIRNGEKGIVTPCGYGSITPLRGDDIMNLLPLPVEEIPINQPLPWRLYDRNGYIVFAKGELVTSREQLETLLPAGLMRDIGAPLQPGDGGDWDEFGQSAPVGQFPPSGIKPQVGELVQLRLLSRAQSVYYTARLIGYVKNLSLLVMTPVQDGVPLILADGEPLEVRMVTGNNIYVFRTAIQRLCISPMHYMHLDYPAVVRMQELRKSPWVRLNLSATVTDARGAREVVRLVNLSPDGALLQAPLALGTTGDELRLAFHADMDHLGTLLDLQADIVNAPDARKPATDTLEYGIAFRNVPAAEALWLKGLVYRHIAEGHAG
jgi:hypothetical protein